MPISAPIAPPSPIPGLTHARRLTRQFSFEAAHRLPNHPGRCRNLHGHSWKAEVWILGSVDPSTGMVFDFGDLKHIGNALFDEQWDHSTILCVHDPLAPVLLQTLPNSRIVLLDSFPTSECLSYLAKEHFRRNLPSGMDVSVRIWETENCSATS